MIKIGNKKADEAMALMRPVISYENEQGFKNMLQYYLNGAELLQATGITEQADNIPAHRFLRHKDLRKLNHMR